MALSKQQRQRQQQSNGNGKSTLFKLGRKQQPNTSNSSSGDNSSKRFGSTRSSYSADSLRLEEFEQGLNGAIGDPLAQLKRWPGLQVTAKTACTRTTMSVDLSCIVWCMLWCHAFL
jgi:hypothetical protein